MNSHNLLITFLVVSVFYNGFMAWAWNVVTLAQFFYLKAIPAILSVASLIYLLFSLGYLIALK